MTHLTADGTPNMEETGASHPTDTPRELLLALREQLLARCNTEEELKTLCADLDVNYDDLPAQGREAKAREFVAWLDRHDRIQGGLNQLWRNQLLGLSIEQDERQPYRHVVFSVVKHPHNKHLDKSLAKYQSLIANNPKFSVFTSADVIASATALDDPELDQWIAWYRNLYAL